MSGNSDQKLVRDNSDGSLLNEVSLGQEAISFNQDGETGEYIQTNLDMRTKDKITISMWFTTEDVSSIQTLIWQGVNTENGWGGGGTSTENRSEFNVKPELET